MNHDEPIEGLVKALHTTSPFYKNSTFENERKFIKRRLKCFKILIVILVILCCVLIGFVIYLTLFPQSGVFFKPLSPFLKVGNTSHSDVLVASKLIQSMDVNLDPCEDFYSYACNGWIKRHPLPKVKQTDR